MMVVVVSECTAAAWRRSRPVVDRYLERIGERTWRGRLTAEGLHSLRADLLCVASRDTSVAAHSVQGKARFVLEWVVGSYKAFDASGRRATYRGGAYSKYLSVSGMSRDGDRITVDGVMRLAGIWHDVGKANPFFQAKVRADGRHADPVRHELLSACAFVDVVRSLPPGVAWTDGEVRAAILGALGQRSFTEGQDVDVSPAFLDAGRTASFPAALRRVAWLVATHHRLLDADVDPASPTDAAGRYKPGHHVTVEPGSTFTRSVAIDPAVVTDDLVRVTADLLRRLAVVPDGEVERLLPWPVVATACRLALVLADREVSRSAGDGAPAGTPVANGRQTLGWHLAGVSRAAAAVMASLSAGSADAPSLAYGNLPRVLRGPATGRYAWQEGAEATARAAAAMAGGRRGAFLVLAASTGSGKTRTVPRVMAAFGDVRYTLAMPTRSLTDQTGAVYRREVGMAWGEVAVVTGLSPDGRDPDRRRCTWDGDVSSGIDLAGDGEWAAARAPVPAYVEPHVDGDAKARHLLSAPILVSTVDQVSEAADMRRTRHVVAGIRMATSDLVLDEADAYGERDLVALGRLAFVAGAMGRKVVLSSASVTPEQAAGFLAAYRSGWVAHASAHGLSPEVVTALVSDAPGCDAVGVLAPDDAPGAAFDGPLHALAARGPTGPVLRRGAILPVAAMSRASIDDAVVDGLRRLHADHGVVDPATGRRFSRLLVAVSRVRTCVELARMLAGRFAEQDVRIVVHHARFLGYARQRTEAFLDAVAGPGAGLVPREPELRRWLSTAGPDAMLVVVATPVIESGNDLDFDGAVVEATGMRPFVQVVGRVMRHRWLSPATPNVLFLPSTFRHVDDPSDPRPFSRPGVQVAMDPLMHEPFVLGSAMLADLVEPSDVLAPTARPRQCASGAGVLASLERARLAAYLGGDLPFTLDGYHSEARRGYLAARHAEKVRFRAGHDDLEVYLEPATGSFVDVDGASMANVLRPGHVRLPDVLGLPGTRPGMQMSDEEQPGRMSLRVSVPDDGKRYTYSPVLGVHL